MRVLIVDDLEKLAATLGADFVVVRAGELEALKTELAETKRKLAERKLVERAKGILMRSRGLDEETAYTMLRKLAMDRSLKLAEVAQSVLNANSGSGP